MSPPSRFISTSWTPASSTAAAKASRSTPAGHQHSTAAKPAALARAKRSSSGTSVKSIEQLAAKRGIGPSSVVIGVQ